MKLISYMKKHKLMPAVLFGYLVLFVLDPDKALKAIGTTSYYLIEMVQIMPVIFLLTVSIDILIPKDWILEHLGEKAGMKGSIMALIFGSVSAGPIYAAFPIAKMLMKKGASVGNIVIILSAWAVIKVPMLANEAKFLGPSFMMTRWVLTVFAIFIMGFIMNRTVRIKEENSVSSINPLPIQVDGKYCIGCGLCADKLPEVFKMSNGIATTVKNINISNVASQLNQVTSKCPARAITINLSKEQSND